MKNFLNSRETKNILNQWANRPDHYKIIHAVSENNTASRLYNTRAEVLFREWDVISASLINCEYTQAQRSGKKTDKPSHPWKIYTGLAFEIGFELDVKPQNILGTHCHDVWFPNHAGRVGDRPTGKLENRMALADAILSGKGMADGEILWPEKQKNSYNYLLTPAEVLNKTIHEHYNEILIMGRPDIRAYADFPATMPVKVKNIIVSFVENKLNGRARDGNQKDIYRMVDKLKQLNPNVPVVEI